MPEDLKSSSPAVSDEENHSNEANSSENEIVKKTMKRKLDSSDKSNEAKKKVKTEQPKDEKGKTSEGSIDFLDRVKSRRTDTCASVAKFKFNKKRVRVLTDAEDFPEESDGVVYWMARDQRVQDNWAFLYAQRLALKLEAPLYVCYCLVPKYLGATYRMYDFVLKGLKEVEKECKDLNIPFYMLHGEAKSVLPDFLKKYNIGGVVTDFNPLRENMKWVNDLKEALPSDVPLCQVDAHNIVPCWQASPKLEYGARTIRKKIHDQLKEFNTEFPPVVKHPHKAPKKPEPVDWKAADASLKCDRSVEPVGWAKPGSEGAFRMLESFCNKRLKNFNSQRNDPTKQALSNLSPWIHFGQISVARAVIMVRLYRNSGNGESVDAFIEEAIVRRELADNFCFYNEKYDSIKGAYKWAKDTLKQHAGDKRPFLYDRDTLENGKTHDHLWNAAQIQMVTEGKMHGFLRMYWAKKILEWTESPEVALKTAIYLNDRFSLDGRDPNGFVGCMWSICGIHDQGWAEREVFGKIRYMNYNGCKRKFDVGHFEAKYRKKAVKQ